MAHLHRWALAFLGSGLGGLRDSATSVWPSVTIPHRADSRQMDIHGRPPLSAEPVQNTFDMSGKCTPHMS